MGTSGTGISSIDGDVETIAMTSENLNANGTFNIVNKTKTGYYYGGYYYPQNQISVKMLLDQ